MLEKSMSKLSEDEKKLVYDSIAYISILIAGADGVIENKEVEWSRKITKIRSYTYHDDMKDFYMKVGETFYDKLNALIAELPRDGKKRNEIISERLSGLTEILQKLDIDFADLYYSSLKSFAKHVAQSAGGFLDYGSISYKESKIVDLPMIEYDFDGKVT